MQQVYSLSDKKHSSPRKASRLLAVLLLLLIFSACQPEPVIEPEVTPIILEAHITPSLRVFAPQFQTCAQELPNTGLVLIDAEGLTEEAALPRLTLRWGTEPAPSGYAAVLADERMVVVVHPDNPMTSMGVSELRAIYQGRQVEWSSPAEGDVEAWSYSPTADITRIFEKAVMEGEAISPRAAGIVPDPAAMLEVVASSPQAAGFLPESWLNEQVKVVDIEGIEAEELSAPILAISPAEPQGWERSWLICLQDTLR